MSDLTKQDLADARSELRSEIAAVRGGVAVMEVRMTALENRLIAEFNKGAAIIARAMHEHLRTEISTVEDKQRQLVAEIAVLRDDFERHMRKFHQQKRARAPRAKRSRSR